MKTASKFIAILSILAVLSNGWAGDSWKAGESLPQRDERLAWWADARFGMFIHFGIYSVPADGEWHMRNKKQLVADYSRYAAEFDPTNFNADAWMSLAHDAGMKFIVITAKHHDGFAMFKSAASRYNIVDASPFKRDVVRELAEACPRHGIRFGVYYSAMTDWGHKGGWAGCPKWDPAAQDGDIHQYIRTLMLPQLKELLTHYGPVSVMWFDNDSPTYPPLAPEEMKQLTDLLLRQPNIVVDGRLNGLAGDFASQEEVMPILPRSEKYWEYCVTINGNWGFSPAKAKPFPLLLRDLITVWGWGGNVLLNVGPNREGQIPEESCKVLRQVGAWMKRNGQAVYGTERGPLTFVPWGTATRKGDIIYLQVFNWPKDGLLKVPVAATPVDAWVITDPAKTSLPVDAKANRLVIHVPDHCPDPVASVVALRIAGNPVASYARFKGIVTTSDGEELSNSNSASDTIKAWQDVPATGSISIDLEKPQLISVCRIGIVTKWEDNDEMRNAILEVKQDGVWKPIMKGIALQNGANVITFPPVQAREIRFSFTGMHAIGEVNEFAMYPPL